MYVGGCRLIWQGWLLLLGASRAFEPCGRLRRSRFVLRTGGFVGQWLEMDGKEGGRGYLVVQVFNVLLNRINQLNLVLLYHATNLHKCHLAERSQYAEKAHTFVPLGQLKAHWTQSISFAVCAIPSLSLNLAGCLCENHAINNVGTEISRKVSFSSYSVY